MVLICYFNVVLKGDPSPISMRAARLPVLEVLQLGDSVHRHLKAEDAAFKRIRDLEMQLTQLKEVSQVMLIIVSSELTLVAERSPFSDMQITPPSSPLLKKKSITSLLQ